MGAPRNYGDVLRVNTVALSQGADGLKSTVSIRVRPAGKNISAQVDVSGVRESLTLLALAPHDLPPCGPKDEEPRLLSTP